MIREIQALSDILSLPSLSSLKSNRSTNRGASPLDLNLSASVAQSIFNSAGVAGIGSTNLQGSLLPSANQKMKSHVSVISSRRITGRGLQLCNELDTAFVQANELVSWYRVNPFSPLMNGDIIYL